MKHKTGGQTWSFIAKGLFIGGILRYRKEYLCPSKAPFLEDKTCFCHQFSIILISKGTVMKKQFKSHDSHQ